MTKHQIENQETVKTSANQFVVDVRKSLFKYEADEVINTDQSGIQLELRSTRTLNHKGEKVTMGSVRSINATTYSYTVQPTITLDGHLLSPVYLCLKEPKGHMSENIRSHLFKASNVMITCSSSGKLTTFPSRILARTRSLPVTWSTQEVSTYLGLLGRTDIWKGIIR